MLLGTAVLAVLAFTWGARADSVDIGLTQTSQTAAPGSIITFDATVTNPSPTNTIYLNGDSSVTSSTLLTVDDTPFLTNFPLSLDPSQASGPLALFNVFIDPNTPDGTYDLNSFSVLGGLDGSAFETLGTTDFSVIVASPVLTAPEPATLSLLLLGLFSLVSIGVLKRELPTFRRQ